MPWPVGEAAWPGLDAALLSFVGVLCVFAAIGAAAARRGRGGHADYLLAGRRATPGQVALSAIASNSSGFMFIGQIGFAYEFGLQALALAAGWKLGDFAATSLVHRAARQESGRLGALSLPELLARWGGGAERRALRRVAAALTVLFLAIYAAAQIAAGGKALHAALGWEFETGVVLGGVMIALCCWAGGVRASLWTDVAQGLVMAAAMAMMLGTALIALGGLEGASAALARVDREYWTLFPQEGPFGPLLGPLLFLAGWVMGGVGVVAQPHIAVRFLMLEKPEAMRRARLYYYGWSILYTGLTLCAAFLARALGPELGAHDPEMALPRLADQHLPGLLVGFLLAGIFAATLSTADSQIIGCASSLAHDFGSGKARAADDGATGARIAALTMVAAASALALYGTASVFQLVLGA